jgi:hypothetical protein
VSFPSRRYFHGSSSFSAASIAYRCLALNRNGAEHRLPHRPPMNPTLLGNPSNGSHHHVHTCFGSARIAPPWLSVHPGPPLGRLSPKQGPRNMFSVRWGQIKQSNGAKSEYRNQSYIRCFGATTHQCVFTSAKFFLILRALERKRSSQSERKPSVPSQSGVMEWRFFLNVRETGNSFPPWTRKTYSPVVQVWISSTQAALTRADR